jgi:S1-C subfamily serine protease
MQEKHLYTIFLSGLLLFNGLKPAKSQGISTEHNYAMNAPAVAVVQSVYSATVYVNNVKMNISRFDNLVDSIRALDTTGTIFSPAQKLDMVVKALYKSPFRFFSAGEEYYRQVHRVQGTGTGFFVTGDGYVVTNAHIIDRDSAYIRNKFILSTFQEVTRQNIDALQSSWAMTLNEEQRNLLYSAYGLIFSQLSSMIIFDLKKDIFVIYRGDSDTGTVTFRKQARLIKKGNPMPGKDVAILKIDDVTNLPTLSPVKDPVIRIGTEVLVFGYPEPATSNVFLAAESLEPTLTSGIVSAIKKSINGWSVIQMDASISHGSSGSPVCNDNGEVIGLATFGSLEQNKTSLASGFNFAIPFSIVMEYMDSARLRPELSKTTVLFNEGLEFFYHQFYRKALDKFQQVKKLNPNYFQVNLFIDQCNSKIAKGNDRQSPPRKYVFIIMIVIAVMTAAYLLFIRKK